MRPLLTSLADAATAPWSGKWPCPWTTTTTVTSRRPAGTTRARRLQDAAREAGLFAPHAPDSTAAGLGLGMVDRAPVFEEAGYSLFGPLALNIAAPDEGNIHLLDHVATAASTRPLPAAVGPW